MANNDVQSPNGIFAISCPATTLCVGTGGKPYASVVISTNPAASAPTWRVASSFGYVGELQADVSCASTSLCVAVDGFDALTSTDLTATAPSWTGPALIDGLPPGILGVRGSPASRGPTLKFGVNCTGEWVGAERECNGAATLTTTERLAANGRTVTGVTAAAKAKRRRTVVIGRATIALTASVNTVYTVKVGLNATGKRLLARFNHLPATLSVTASASELRFPPRAITIKTARVTFKTHRKNRHTR